MDDGWMDGWTDRRNEETNKPEEIQTQKDDCGESEELRVIKSYHSPT